MTREIVVPGEIVSKERKRLGGNVFIQNGNIVSSVVGVKSEYPDMVGVVALKGKYVPLSEDFIVGIVASEKHAGYIVEINSFNQSFLLKDEAVDQLKVGSIITAKIGRVNELKEADLYEARMIVGGDFVSVPAVKVPRIIGKNASMVNTIKDLTHANLFVGRNGFIVVKGDHADVAIEAIRFIEENSHQENLTNTVMDVFTKKMQEKMQKLGKPMLAPLPRNEDSERMEGRENHGSFSSRPPRFESRNRGGDRRDNRSFEPRRFNSSRPQRDFRSNQSGPRRDNFRRQEDSSPPRSFEPKEKFEMRENKQPEFKEPAFERREAEPEAKPKKRFGFF